MSPVQPRIDDRAKSAIIAVVLQGLIVWALVVGLGVTVPAGVRERLAVFGVAPERPPRVATIPPRLRSRRPEGAAAPPNLRSKRTELVAPPPVLPPAPPPPVIVADAAGIGVQASAGASTIRGPGSGSGGQGDGTGSGGDGDGDGGGARDETPPRWMKGRIRDSDYPREADEADASGTVSVRYVVWTDGRVRDCRVTRSSGSAALDATTCRLIVERFRYRPSLDELGRPVPSVIVEDHSWFLHREPAEPR